MCEYAHTKICFSSHYRTTGLQRPSPVLVATLAFFFAPSPSGLSCALIQWSDQSRWSQCVFAYVPSGQIGQCVGVFAMICILASSNWLTQAWISRLCRRQRPLASTLCIHSLDVLLLSSRLLRGHTNRSFDTETFCFTDKERKIRGDIFDVCVRVD